MAIQSRNYFFTPTVNHERFLSQDEPTEQVMRDLLDSVPFKNQVSDTATETQQGLVEMATQDEFDNGVDNNANGWALYVRPSFIKTKFTSFFSVIQAQLDQFEQQITNIQNQITTINGNITTITNQFGEDMPIGSILMWPKAIAPNAKWMICEGQSLDKTVYVELFALIGYDFGGSGLNFFLPDMRSKFVAGYNSGGAIEYQTIGQGAGENTVTLTGEQSGIAAHTHTVTEDPAGAHSHTFNINVREPSGGGANIPSLWKDNGDNAGVQGYPGFEGTTMSSAANHVHNVAVQSISNTPASEAHENRPDFIVFPYMIKVSN